MQFPFSTPAHPVKQPHDLARKLLAGAAMVVALALGGVAVHGDLGWKPALADEEPPPPPPPPEDDDSGAPSPDDVMGAEDDGGTPPPENSDIAPMEPGEAVVTRFSHTVEQPGDDGAPVTVIDLNGISASIIDIRKPGEPPTGQHWLDEPQRLLITAAEVGQVFGVALGNDSTGSPDIYLSATSAYGLHRLGPDWMPGQWGPDAGPGTIFRVSEDTGFGAEKFADVTLDGRANTGASLGNIAYDRWHGLLFVSDLETGMIHALDAKTGAEKGRYDHGKTGRVNFLDAWTGKPMALNPLAFDPASKARIEDCPSAFTKTPECWNIADFRRRVWGLSLAQDGAGNVRLYYSVWGSEAFGNPEWVSAEEDRRNAVWSVALGKTGQFDTSSIRREYFMPGFWPADGSVGGKSGNNNAVSDIAFPNCGPQGVMLTAERGAQRNLGLDQAEAFARPYESRVVRHELGNDGVWRPKGRYDVGFHDRTIKDGPPTVYAGSAGGAAFGFGLDAGFAVLSEPSASVWMTGDGLCSPQGACTHAATGEHGDTSEVHGLQGMPASAIVPIEEVLPLDPKALDQSYMIDTDINLRPDGEVIAESLARNDATRIGDVAIYEKCGAPLPPVVDEPPVEDGGLPPVIEPPDENLPIHTRNQSHDKWNSTGHRSDRSWHYREGSWHYIERSWHWRSQSYHWRNQSWHWRGGSWHTKARSWHRRNLSAHDRRYSWHYRERSWHYKGRTYHLRDRTWSDTHVRGRTYHQRNRTWNDAHVRGKSYHVKNRTWSGDHFKNRSYHVKDRTWTGNHVKGRTYHRKSITWGGNPLHVKGKTFHVKGQTYGQPNHVKDRTYHKKDRTWHRKNVTFGDQPNHVKDRTYHKKDRTWHKKDVTFGGGEQPNHVKDRTYHKKDRTWHRKDVTFGGGEQPNHVKDRTWHKKDMTFGDGNENQPVHKKGKTFHTKGKTFGGGNDNQPVHKKGKTFHVKGRTFATQDGQDGQELHNKRQSKKDQDNVNAKKRKHRKNKSFHQSESSRFATQ